MKRDLPDYYEILQVSRQAHPMIITRAFRLLAAFYHPDNRETGDQEAFRKVLEAHHVLSDPVRRASYDRAKFATGSRSPSDHRTDVDGVGDGQPRDERHLRSSILEALYHIRRSRPYNPALPALAIAELFGRSMEEIQFSLWYLRGKKWIEMPDGSDFAITIAGVDAAEANGVDAARASSTPSKEMIPLPAAGLSLPERDPNSATSESRDSVTAETADRDHRGTGS